MTRPRSPRRTLTGSHPATGRAPTATEGQSRYRHGDRAPSGVARYVWSHPRNGLPVFRPYVYRGQGPFAGEEW
jgi:hypothetical protein